MCIFWKLDRGDYKWITPARLTLMQDFLPDEFQQMASGTEVVGCIAVQAAPTDAETDFLFCLLYTSPSPRDS